MQLDLNIFRLCSLKLKFIIHRFYRSLILKGEEKIQLDTGGI